MAVQTTQGASVGADEPMGELEDKPEETVKPRRVSNRMAVHVVTRRFEMPTSSELQERYGVELTDVPGRTSYFKRTNVPVFIEDDMDSPYVWEEKEGDLDARARRMSAYIETAKEEKRYKRLGLTPRPINRTTSRAPFGLMDLADPLVPFGLPLDIDAICQKVDQLCVIYDVSPMFDLHDILMGVEKDITVDIRLHNVIKRRKLSFQCNFCGYVFKSSINSLEYQSVHSQETVKEQIIAPLDARPFCPECRRTHGRFYSIGKRRRQILRQIMHLEKHEVPGGLVLANLEDITGHSRQIVDVVCPKRHHFTAQIKNLFPRKGLAPRGKDRYIYGVWCPICGIHGAKTAEHKATIMLRKKNVNPLDLVGKKEIREPIKKVVRLCATQHQRCIDDIAEVNRIITEFENSKRTPVTPSGTYENIVDQMYVSECFLMTPKWAYAERPHRVKIQCKVCGKTQVVDRSAVLRLYTKTTPSLCSRTCWAEYFGISLQDLNKKLTDSYTSIHNTITKSNMKIIKILTNNGIWKSADTHRNELLLECTLCGKQFVCFASRHKVRFRCPACAGM